MLILHQVFGPEEHIVPCGQMNVCNPFVRQRMHLNILAKIVLSLARIDLSGTSIYTIPHFCREGARGKKSCIVDIKDCPILGVKVGISLGFFGFLWVFSGFCGILRVNGG